MLELLKQAISSCHNKIWDSEVSKVSFLASVLNLLAKALVLGVNVADEAVLDEAQDFIFEEHNAFVPDEAENSIARTVVTV
jgi:hypothetical protein